MNVTERIKQHEGWRSKPYRCPAGKLTIGYGFNIEQGISLGFGEIWLEYLIEQCRDELTTVFTDAELMAMGEERVDALTDMVYNLGIGRFKRFKRMIRSLKNQRWQQAAKEALKSKWATQVGKRANRIAETLKTGD